MFFRATLREPSTAPGPESLEADAGRPEDIPWADIAFPSTDYTLQRYLEDRAAGRENHYFTDDWDRPATLDALIDVPMASSRAGAMARSRSA